MRKLSGVVAVLLVGLVGGAIAFASPTPQHQAAHTYSKTLRLGVAFSPLNLVDIGEQGLSAGDHITSFDRLFNQEGRQVGHDGIACTVTNADPESAETICEVIFQVPGGTITGQFFSRPGPAMKVGAVTGGTGIYRKARGHFTLVESGQDENIEGNKLVIRVTDVIRPSS